MKTLLIAAIAFGAYSNVVLAEIHSDTTRSPAGTQTESSTQASAGMVVGEVRKVDKSANKITLKHGELMNLGMPPMTMVFRVKDPAMLDQVKAGDEVRFTADRMNGAITVTAIELAR